MRERTQTARLLAASFVLGAALTLLVSQGADAAPPSDCRSLDYDVMARQGSQSGNHIGIKASLWLSSGNNDCAKINTLNVINSNGFVEWGYILGWDNCGANGNTYQSSPQGFVVWKPINGDDRCIEVAGWASGQFTNLELRDTTSDTVWGYFRDLSLQGTVDVNFDRGTGYTLGERKTNGDSAWAHFKYLKWMLAGSAGTWRDFNDLDDGPDTDPVYNCRHISESEQKVQDLSKTCS